MHTEIEVQAGKEPDVRMRGFLEPSGELHIALGGHRTLSVGRDGKWYHWDVQVNERASPAAVEVYIDKIVVSRAKP